MLNLSDFCLILLMQLFSPPSFAVTVSPVEDLSHPFPTILTIILSLTHTGVVGECGGFERAALAD
jgi:hypothetical protein